MKCGASPLGHHKFCRRCGVALNPEQIVCIKCGAGVLPGRNFSGGYGGSVGGEPKNKLAAGLLAIFLGWIGIHKFYMGNVMPGVVYLLLCWTGIPGILGLIEGIIYLMDTDEAFQARVEAKKFFM
jgi:TM2 domain-containing membrane protein YozV